MGEAWRRAWDDGLANPDPFQSSSLPDLWYGINSVNDPPITKPDCLHPSVYGAYLSGLVLFVQMTGADVRTLGANERAAGRLGIPGAVACSEYDAWQAVKQLRHTTRATIRAPGWRLHSNAWRSVNSWATRGQPFGSPRTRSPMMLC